MKIKRIFTPNYYGLDSQVNRRLYASSFFLALLMAVISILLFRWLPERVPLYFNRPWGEERLAQNYMLFSLPVLSVIFAVFNLFLGKKLGKHSDTIITTFAVTSSSVSFMMFLGMLGVLRSIL